MGREYWDGLILGELVNEDFIFKRRAHELHELPRIKRK